MVDTKSERFGVPSFSFYLHQIVSILMSIVLSCDIEPYLDGKQFDLFFRNIYVDVASNHARIHNYAGSPDYVLVFDKYSLGTLFNVPSQIRKMSFHDDNHIVSHGPLSSNGSIPGTYSQDPFLNDTNFLENVAPIYQRQLILSLQEENKTPSFDDFCPTKPDLSTKFNSFITRVPYNYIARKVDSQMDNYEVFERKYPEDDNDPNNLDFEYQPVTNADYFMNFYKAKRGKIPDWHKFNEADLEIERSSASLDQICAKFVTWLNKDEAGNKGYDDYILNNPPTVGSSFQNNVWMLKDPINQDIYRSDKRRYELVSESEFNILSIQYIEDIKKYAELRNKNYLSICSKNYGSHFNEIIDPSITEYTIRDWQREIYTRDPMRVDEELFALLGKTMPEKSSQFLLMTFNTLKSSTVFQEAMFMRQISESIVLQKKNTKSKRMLIEHPFLQLACTVSIVGNMTSNDSDAGFAYIRFHYQLRNGMHNSIPGFATHPNVVSDAKYNCMSQGFKIRKPDIAWFLALPEKMIAMTYSMLEERGELNIVTEIDKIQHLKYITLCNLSIMNRASWRISKILKPYKYYIINLSQKSPFTKQAETKFLSEYNSCNGATKLPEFTYMLRFLYKNIHNPDYDGLTPVFRLPLEMMGSEAYIMNLCPKMLYGRKRHLIKCYEAIAEETDLYCENLGNIEALRNHSNYIYKKWTYTESDEKLIIEHMAILRQVFIMTDGRFAYSPLSQCLILQEIKNLYTNIPNMGSIHHPQFSTLISTKGAFSTFTGKNCKSIEGMAELSASLPANIPTTTLSAAAVILSEEHEHFSTPLLYAIVPKDQVGGDREISMMNEKFRILQAITESVSKHFGTLTGIDKLADSNKDSNFYKTALLGGKTFAFMGDQTRWGPNFNTAIFGDMFKMFYLAGIPCTFIPEVVCYMAQRKLFLCPEGIDLDRITSKMHSTVAGFKGIHAPAHMGEGIFHYTSSLYHSIVTSSFCRIIKTHMNMSIHNIYPMVTSDDLTIIHKHVEETDIPKLNNAYLNIQNFLMPFSIKTSAYKNITSRDYIEFNSMAVFNNKKTFMSQSLKQMVGNVNVPISHTFWNDLMYANSTFNTLLNSGCSFSQAYISYLLNTTLSYRRWGMTKLFYRVGYFRILKIEELLQNVSLFNRDYTIEKNDGEIRIRKSSDSVSVFKFRTYERLSKCWYTFRDFSEKLRLVSQSRIFTLSNSPESNATPISKFILPTSFKTKATVRVGDVSTLKSFLGGHAVDDSRASLELTAVISARSGNWSGSHFSGLTLEQINVPYNLVEPGIYLSNLMTYLTMSLRVDTKILSRGIQPPAESTKTAIHKMRKRVTPSLDAEALMVMNFGSYHENLAGNRHLQILRRSGNCHLLSESLRNAMDHFFDSYEDKYTFISTLCQVLEDALNKSSMRVLGIFSEQNKNPLTYNFVKNTVCDLSLVKSSICIPMSLIFQFPLTSFEINPDIEGVPVSSKKMIHCITDDGKHNMMVIPNLSLSQDRDLFISKDNMGVNMIYVKPLTPTFLSMEELCQKVDWSETPQEDLRVIVLNSDTVIQERVVIHPNVEDDIIDRSQMDELFELIQRGDLDSVTKALIVDNDYDSHMSTVSFAREEKDENKRVDLGDAGDWDDLGGFLDGINEGKGADVQLQTSVVEIDDPDIKRMIIACRDGYFLKRAAQQWFQRQTGRLYKYMYVPDLDKRGMCFSSNLILQVYSEVYTRRGIKMPDSLLMLTSQIFESSPVSDIVFYRDGRNLYVNAAAIKLAVISRDMQNSRDARLNFQSDLPLFSLCRAYGRSL